MADPQTYTTSDPQFWRVGKSGGMVPYNHPEATDQQWTGSPGTAQPTNGAGTATTSSGGSGGSYTGAVDTSLQKVTPATPTLQPSPIPYVPTIPTGATGGSQPSAPPTDTSKTTYTAGGVQVPQGTPGAQVTVADDFGTGAAKPTQSMDDLVRSRLMDLLGTDPNAISTQDADIAPQSRAYNAQIDQAVAAQRAQALEEANAEGTSSSGGTVNRLGSLTMQGAQAKGANDASLLGQKQTQRIAQLQNAIQVATQMGMTEQANDLQRQLANLQAQVTERGQDVTSAGQQMQVGLANLDASTKLYLGNLNAQMQQQGYSTQERLAAMDAEVRKLGINTQGDLGQLDIALRTSLGYGQLNLGLISTLLNNNQANNTTGFNYAALLAGLNQNAATFGGG